MNYPLIVILGPTASGKTAIAARLAFDLNGEVISADSRQVYRGMDIGTGKDLGDYVVSGTRIPCHLVDIADPGYEYSIFEYQRDFLVAFNDITARGRQPILCGGSGMYIEAVVKGYHLPYAPEDAAFLASLAGRTDGELADMLHAAKTLHNVTDLEDRPRMLKALLVEHSLRTSGDQGSSGFPGIPSIIFGIRFPREEEMTRIARRLRERLDHGMIAEVEQLLAHGVPMERLIRYGLEYRYVSRFLAGELTRDELFDKLNIAIRQFAKRQMTWFRRMEKQGLRIRWIDGRLPVEEKLGEIQKQIYQSGT